jgi:glycerol kinase
MTPILALDQGTTSSRAIVFNEKGNILGIGQREFAQHFPNSGWVEHDANEIWSSQRAVIDQALSAAAVSAAQIGAIGITNQRETTVAWNAETGQPICNAIVWQDRRTAGFCDALRAAGHADMFQQKTGLVLDAYFSGTKMAWILANVPEAKALASKGTLRMGTIDSWLIWKLTDASGVTPTFATDPSNASRTLLFNIHENNWDEELLALLGVPRSALATIVPSSGVVAHANLNGARIPIAGIAGDQQAALFGQGCHTRGMAKNTYGTGCFMLMNTGENAVPSQAKLLTTSAWQLENRYPPLQGEGQEGDGAPRAQPPAYALEGSVFIAGALIQWLRDGLKIIESASQVEALAASVPDSGGVVVVPAFVGLGAPHWDSYARGTVFGLTRGTTRAHIARAALEAIAYQSAEVLTAMQADSGIALNELRVDGGATANNLLMQFQADILAVSVVRPKVAETTALGAAYLAGLGVGIFSSKEEIASHWQRDRVFTPNMSRDDAAARMAKWRKAVERSKGWELEG